MPTPRHKTLFVPGPTEVRDDVLQELARPMVAHRQAEFTDLCRRVYPRLGPLFGTERPVMVATGAATGLMEAALRNTVDAAKSRVLSLSNGAFGDRWYDIAVANDFAADRLAVEWNEPIRARDVEAALGKADYGVVTLVYNETSTGLMNPLAEIAEVVSRHDDTLLLVDCVSCLGGAPVDVDRLSVDVCLAGSQKALALPPGLVLFTVSDRAMRRAESIRARGYFLDFLAYRKSYDQNTTPHTPAISLFYALEKQMERIAEEGLPQRFARHRAMAELTRAWARGAGFDIYPAEGYESPTVTCIRNTRSIDMKELSQHLAERGATIAGGYGRLKGETFRIGHMGDLTVEEVRTLLSWIDAFLASA